jgi:alpha-L-fucosidase
MEERLVKLGEWLEKNGEAIYETTAFNRAAQWSEGTRPHLEEKEFRSEYDITKLVDQPAAGYSHIEAFFTAKGNAVYAILPEWPGRDVVLRDLAMSGDAKISLLETKDELRWQRHDDGVMITVPQELRSRVPFRQAYVLKVSGVERKL